MTLNRREAEMGFGDEIPKRGMGWQPHRNPKRKAQPKMNQGAKRYLIPLTPHPPAPSQPQPNASSDNHLVRRILHRCGRFSAG